MSFNPLRSLLLRGFQDAVEKMASKARGIPWLGRKMPGSYMAYHPNITNGIATLRSGRRYQVRHDGWRAMHKPQSRRAQHRLAVAARKAGRA